MLLVYLLLCSVSIVSVTFSLTLCLLKTRRKSSNREIRTDNNLAYSVHSSPIHPDIQNNISPSQVQPEADEDYDYVFPEQLFPNNNVNGVQSSSLRSVNNNRRPNLFDNIRLETTGGSVRLLQTDERMVDFEEVYQSLKRIKAEKEKKKTVNEQTITTNSSPDSHGSDYEYMN